MSAADSPTNSEDATIDAWRQAFELDHLIATRILRSGRSGAEVRLVEFSRRGGELKIGILKVARDEKDFEREFEGQGAAGRSWLAPLVPEAPDRRQVGRQFFLLSALALPSGLQRESPTLQSLLDGGYHDRARQVARALAKFYGTRAVAPQIEIASRSPFDHLREIFSPWAAKAARFDWPAWGFPATTDESYIDGLAIRVNPLWCAFHEEAWETDRIGLAVGLQHGDLNPRNIIVAEKIPADAPCADAVRLIDFEKVRVTSFFLDICCLSLWLIFESAQGRSLLTAPDWDAVPDALASRFLADVPDERIAASFKVPLDLVDDLVRGVRGAVEGRLAQKKLVDDMLALTLAVCALARANYELRELERGRDDPDRPVDPECLRRAVCLFRVASRAFEKCYGLKAHRRHAGDLALADFTGLIAADASSVVSALEGNSSVDTIEQVVAAAARGHALSRLAAERIRRRLRRDRTAHLALFRRLKERLEAETVDMDGLRRLMSLVDLDDRSWHEELTLRFLPIPTWCPRVCSLRF